MSTQKPNPQQHEAVTYNDGPLLIVAGAGTGKTSVIVDKISHLVNDLHIKPEQILALTFTEKAALEMEERVDRRMPYGYFQMMISTFHSFADHTLREHATHTGLDGNYRLMSKAESILFFKKHMFQMALSYFRPVGNPYKFIDDMLQHFGRLQDEDTSTDEYIAWASGQQESDTLSDEEKMKHMELARAFEQYQRIKVEKGMFEFGDLMYYLLALLRKRPSVLKQIQDQYPYVLVDEFQDTNIVQYDLLKLLYPASHAPHLTVVGDDSQAIYKFRGASVSNILTFMKDYPQAKQITLTHNYRSYQHVLDVSYRLIRHNDPDTLEARLGISKELKAHRKSSKECVSLHLANHGDHEATWVAQTIRSLIAGEEYRYRDIAILVRAHSHVEPFVQALVQEEIPYQFIGPGMLFRQPEIKDLIAYFNVLNNVGDSVSFYRILTMRIFGLDAKDLSLLNAFAKKTGLDLFQAVDVYCSHAQGVLREEHVPFHKHLPVITEFSRVTLCDMMAIISDHLRKLKTDSAPQLLYDFLDRTGYMKDLFAMETKRDEKIAQNVSKLFNILKVFETNHEDASVPAVVEYLQLSHALNDSPPVVQDDIAEYDAVHVLTIHGSKGLEYPVVFLPTMVNGRFPTYAKRDPLPIPPDLIKEQLPEGDYHLQEERRLCYVGITRARDRVYLSASKIYGDGKRQRKLSTFLTEALGEDVIDKICSIKHDEEQQLSIFSFKPAPEQVIPAKKLPLHTFSYSQLETFKTCPLQYKFGYILKVPSPDNHAASFGQTIHNTLQTFYAEAQHNPDIDVDRLIALFHQEWIPLGYHSMKHQQEAQRVGEEMVRGFYSTFYSGAEDIVSLERMFKIKLDEGTYLIGRIDRIDRISETEVEIIDYKTGKKPDEAKLKKDTQLTMYALAASDPALFGTSPDNITLTFYYLQTMERVSMHKTQEDIMAVREDMLATIDTLRSSDFKPKPGVHCSFCAYRSMCDAAFKG